MSVAEELAKLRALVETPRREKINGRESAPELLDPVPLEMPIGYGGPPSMRELVQEYVRETMSESREPELGSFEEEDDFGEEEPELLDLSGFEVVEYEMVEEFAPEAPASPAPPAAEPPAEPAIQVEAPQEPPVDTTR